MEELLCQVDPYLASIRAGVVECRPSGDGTWRAILDRTVFYPEGGGQPSDLGSVGERRVLGVSRDGDGRVIHILDGSVSGDVEAVVDWERRFDHMQQHTAQHILTALALDRHGWPTTAFHLGALRSDVELDAPRLTLEDLSPLEDEVNRIIREDRKVGWTVVEAGDLPASGVRSRRLPRGLEGAVRLVEIDGVDLNTCGGTHVSRTGEIGMLKIVDTEQLRGGTRVFFLAGGRVSTAFDGMLARERAMSRLLTCPPSDHLEAVSRTREESRTASLAVRAMRTELAAHLAGSLAAVGSFGSLHRPEPDMELLRSVADALRSLHPGAAALLAGGEWEGVFILVGPPGLASEAGPAVARILEGRGGGPPGLYQGRASRLDRFGEAVSLVEVELGRQDDGRA